MWPLVLLLSFGAASFLTAALHGPWWLKILGLLVVLMISGTWSLRSAELSGGSGWLVGGAAIMVGLVVFVILRWRRRFAWWEFVVVWALVGGAMVVGVGGAREAKRFGFELVPQLLQQTASLLGYLALPAAIVAGAAVAEMTVRATVAATRSATRLASRRWPFVILAAVLCCVASRWCGSGSAGIRSARAWSPTYRPLSSCPVSPRSAGWCCACRAGGGPARWCRSSATSWARSGSPSLPRLIVLLPVQVLLAVIQTIASLRPRLMVASCRDPVSGVGSWSTRCGS